MFLTGILAPPQNAFSPRVAALIGAAVVIALILPLYARAYEAPYYLLFASRILVYALAATSLNFILGYGGMVSFGHAAFLSIGAYAVGIPEFHGVTNGFVHLAIAILASTAFAIFTGLIALRTRGVPFIMITLAFAQMVYFVIFSLKQYGGDEGLTIKVGSTFGPVSMANRYALYVSLLVTLALCIYMNRRIIHAPFGMVLRGCMINADRMSALGYPVLRYKLASYAISGVVCGIAGFFLANLTLFASPSYGSWTISGELMLMIVLGGTGTVAGPTIGAFALLIVEDIFKRLSDHWMFFLGVLIIAVGLVAKRGIWGFFEKLGLRS